MGRMAGQLISPLVLITSFYHFNHNINSATIILWVSYFIVRLVANDVRRVLVCIWISVC
jgi:hypothetical protein